MSGSATDGDDYDTVTNARVTFDRNVRDQSYAVHITIDDIIEDPETFSLRLVDPSEGTVVGPQNLLQVTILDSTFRPPTDPPPNTGGKEWVVVKARDFTNVVEHFF